MVDDPFGTDGVNVLEMIRKSTTWKVTVTEWDIEPRVPVTVTGYAPAAFELQLSVYELELVIDVDSGLQLRPDCGAAVSETVPVYPLR